MADVSATTVFLVRHAAHDRVGHMLCGRMPGVTLGPEGRDQAARLAAYLARRRIAAVYASPLERARETAAPIAAAVGLPVSTCEALNEIDCGEWTGRSFAALGADERWHVWNAERARASAPGGETMAAVQARALREIQGWGTAHPGATVVAVSHADVLKAVVCAILGLSLDRLQAFDVEPASLTTLVLWPGGGKVVALNDTLAGAALPGSLGMPALKAMAAA